MLLTGLAPALVLASQIRLVNIEQMTQRAARIFSGRCTAARVVFDESLGHEVTVATFQVERAVKGVTGGTVTVRMLSSAMGSADASTGVPSFRAGEEVVLFLYGESAQGLSSPVGLGQGHFKIQTDKQGRKIVLNEIGNKRLLTGLRSEARARLHLRREGLEPSAGAAHRDEIDSAALLDAAEALAAKGE